MKLVGNFRAVVTHAETGYSAKDKPVVKVTFDVTDEWINGQWMPLPVTQQAVMHYGLGSQVSKAGKTGAQHTAENIKASYGYSGPLSGIGAIVLTPVELVCEDHEGRYTKVQYVNNPNAKPGLKPFDVDTLAELDRIFSSVA